MPDHRINLGSGFAEAAPIDQIANADVARSYSSGRT
jgi:hypothetical protein